MYGLPSGRMPYVDSRRPVGIQPNTRSVLGGAPYATVAQWLVNNPLSSGSISEDALGRRPSSGQVGVYSAPGDPGVATDQS